MQQSRLRILKLGKCGMEWQQPEPSPTGDGTEPSPTGDGTEPDAPQVRNREEETPKIESTPPPAKPKNNFDFKVKVCYAI